jgi:hypothetical protein
LACANTPVVEHITIAMMTASAENNFTYFITA